MITFPCPEFIIDHVLRMLFQSLLKRDWPKKMLYSTMSIFQTIQYFNPSNAGRSHTTSSCSISNVNFSPGGGGGGGGGIQVQRGGAPALRISWKKGSFFKTTTCARFCKRWVLFCTQVRSMRVKIPLQSTKYTRLWRWVTPEVTGLPSLLPPLAAAKQAEDYKILS